MDGAVLEVELGVQDVVDPGRGGLAHLVVRDVGAVGEDVVAGKAVGTVEIHVRSPPEGQLLRLFTQRIFIKVSETFTHSTPGRTSFALASSEGYSSPSMPIRAPWTLCSLMPSSRKRKRSTVSPCWTLPSCGKIHLHQRAPSRSRPEAIPARSGDQGRGG